MGMVDASILFDTPSGDSVFTTKPQARYSTVSRREAIVLFPKAHSPLTYLLYLLLQHSGVWTTWGEIGSCGMIVHRPRLELTGFPHL